MSRPRIYTNEQMIAALARTKGMVYLAAQELGCNPKAIYKRAKSSEEVSDAIRHERGKVVDVAELKLYDAIMKGEAWAIQLALKTLGKDRGYVERLQVEDVTDEEVTAAIEAELARLGLNGKAPDALPSPGANGEA